MKITGKTGRMKVVVAFAALLVSCGPRSDPAAGNSPGNATNPVSSQRQQPPAKGFAYDEENDLIEFHFGWSAEAAAVPQLVDRFQNEMEKA